MHKASLYWRDNEKDLFSFNLIYRLSGFVAQFSLYNRSMIDESIVDVKQCWCKKRVSSMECHLISKSA